MYQQRVLFSSLDPTSPELVKILTYPRFDESDYRARLNEILDLGVSSIIPEGNTSIAGINIAGKGCVGLVVKARVGRKICALKIRRTDANRESMSGEVRLHKIANDAGVGPRLYDHSYNFILMEFAKGQDIAEWTTRAGKRETLEIVKLVLEQCHTLDMAGLDHGQLSKIDRHVIISDKNRTTIIDFETASTMRRTANVTAASQSLLVAGTVAQRISKAVGSIDREAVISALREYKHNQTRRTLKALLHTLGI